MDEKALILAAQKGDVVAFNQLVRTYQTLVYRTAYRVLGDGASAEDATQDAFLRAFRAWSKWKQDAPAEAWVHRIALNVAFSQRRREQLREVGKLVLRLGRPEDPDPTEGLHPELWRELRALPPKQAAAIVLRHLHGYSNREIALTLGIPEATVASRLAAAKARLRARLGDQIED